MKTNILKSFLAMLAIATAFAFAGCTDDEDDEDVIPSIEISESTVSFTNAEGDKTVDITSNADWRAEVAEDDTWVTVTPSASSGNKTVTISVAENTTGSVREAEVKFHALHPTYGPYDTKKLTIIQSANEQEIEEKSVIFSDNFDKEQGPESSPWKYMDTDSETYCNPTGSGAETVSYEGSGVSFRGNQPSNSQYSGYAGSGVNNIFFAANAYAIIKDITVPAGTTCFELTFGGIMSKYGDDAAEWNMNEFHILVSDDNSRWGEVNYSFEEGDDLSATWNDATASFRLAEAPEKLSIKLVADVASVYRIDDITLYSGGAGEQAIEFPVIENIEGTVTEVLEAEQGANVKAIDATVVAVSSRAYLLTDGTSYILAYMSEGEPEVVVGDKVTVDGEMGSYGTPAVPQIINPVATKTGTVENFAQPEAVVIDGAALDAYKDNFAIKYVKIADANLVKNGNFWNFSVEGATSATGSLAYPTAEMCPEEYNAKKVTIYGYVVYLSGASSQYVNVIATSVEVTGEGEPPYEGAEVPETDEADICVDLTDADTYGAILPAEYVKTTAEYMLDGHKFIFSEMSNGHKYDATNKYLIFGKQDAYIELPAIEGKALTMVVATTRDGASKKVNLAIKDADGNVVEGGQEINWAQLNGKLTYAYALTGTEENTSYRLVITNGNNAQLTHLDLYYTGEEIEPVAMEPTAAAEGYQGAKVTWAAVEGAEAYVVYYTVAGEEEAIEVDGETLEAVIPVEALTDAQKYTFKVEAYDAEENLVGEGTTAETEVYTLVNWVEPSFEFALSEDKTTYSFVAKDLAATNYFYVGAEVNIYKDGATTPLYTLTHAHGDAWLKGAYQYARYLFANVNQNKGWYWYDGEGNPVTTKDDGSAKEVTSVPASFFTAGEYTFDYTIAYGVCVNGTWAKDGGNYTSVACDKAEADRVYFVTVDNLLRDADDNIERHSAGIETPATLATVEPTLEFTSVTAKAEGYQGAVIEWSAVETATAYKVVVNGEEVEANGELSHTVAPETLTDANEYTFTVKAYKDSDLLAQKDVTTQVFTLTNRPAPEASFADGVLTVATDLDYTKMGNTHVYGVILAAEVSFYKDGATTPAYTAKATAADQTHVSGLLQTYATAVESGYMKGSNMAVALTSWKWNDGELTATAPEFEPGTYTIDVKGSYFPTVDTYYGVSGGTEKPFSEADRIFFEGMLITPTDNDITATLQSATIREDKAVATVTIEDPDAEPVVLNAKAAIDEGTEYARLLCSTTAGWSSPGLRSINGLFESVKLSWDAVEADKVVIAYDGQTVEVTDGSTSKVIEGLKTSPVEFTISAVKGTETLVEETVSSDVYVLPETAAGVFEAVYSEADSGWKIAGYDFNTQQYATWSCSFSVYAKGDRTTPIASGTKNVSSTTYSYFAWVLTRVNKAVSGSQALQTADYNWDGDNDIFTGLEGNTEYDVVYDLMVWPYIYDAANANNTETAWYYKTILAGEETSEPYGARKLSGTTSFTTGEGPAVEPEIEAISIADFISKADTETVYELTGQIVEVQKRTKYSNFIIKDETGEILVYGLDGDNADESGISVMETKGIDAGDEITVQGAYTLYGSTHEVVDATYVSHTSFTGAWITAVSPAKVAFLAAGGTESVTLTMRNGDGVTPTLSGLTAPFSATWNNGVVEITATENTSTEAVAEQTLTIAVEGGNAVEVAVSQKGVVEAGTKEYDIIDTVAALEAGVEYTLGGYGTESEALYCYTGGTSSGSGYTAAATYDETTGALTITGNYSTTVRLEAVEGVNNAYRIYDIGKSKYLIATAASSGKLSLVDSTADAASYYWVFEAGENTGLSAYQVGIDGVTPRLWMSTAASSKLLRSASASYTDGNMIFFKKN